MAETFTVSLFQRETGQWVSAWTQQVDVEAGATARDAGLDAAQDERLPAGDWELRVWGGDQPDLTSQPDAVVRSGDVLHARGLRVIRGGRVRQQWRTSGQAGQVVHAMRADRIGPGELILVTHDEEGVRPAASQDGAVVAFVKRRVDYGPSEDVIDSVDLVTSLGELRGLLPHQAVLPAAS